MNRSGKSRNSTYIEGELRQISGDRSSLFGDNLQANPSSDAAESNLHHHNQNHSVITIDRGREARAQLQLHQQHQQSPTTSPTAMGDILRNIRELGLVVQHSLKQVHSLSGQFSRALQEWDDDNDDGDDEDLLVFNSNNSNGNNGDNRDNIMSSNNYSVSSSQVLRSGGGGGGSQLQQISHRHPHHNHPLPSKQAPPNLRIDLNSIHASSNNNNNSSSNVNSSFRTPPKMV